MKKQLGIVGHGHIGTALGDVFANHDWAINYYDTKPDLCTVESPEQLAKVSQVIIIAAPARVNRTVAEAMAPQLKGKLLLSVAKGVEPNFITVDAVLEEVSKGAFDVGLLYGPMLAAEIKDHKPASIMLATKNKNWAETFADTEQIQIAYTSDVHSVALCGVLKNIFAIAFGMNDGMNLGINSKAALAVQIIDEFERILEELGGDRKAALGLAGVGDLLATGWGQTSFNYNMGKNLALNPTATEAKGEGVLALKELVTKVELSNYQIIAALYKIIYSNGPLHPLGR